MKYLDFAEYQAIGGVCDETAFDRYIIRASGIITSATKNRIQAMQVVPVEAKHACRDIIEYLDRYADTTDTKVVSRSQTAGNVSQSESYQALSAADMEREIAYILDDYLLNVTDDKGTHLLYRGCDK